jgi:hypothetical protein
MSIECLALGRLPYDLFRTVGRDVDDEMTLEVPDGCNLAVVGQMPTVAEQCFGLMRSVTTHSCSFGRDSLTRVETPSTDKIQAV